MVRDFNYRGREVRMSVRERVFAESFDVSSEEKPVLAKSDL